MIILASMIIEASKVAKSEEVREEKTIREVMTPIEDYTTLNQEITVKEAIDNLRESFYAKVSTSRIMETGHRSILVVDDRGEIMGILAIIDLLRAIMPAYLDAPKPSTADNVQYSPMFWNDMFQREVIRLAGKKIQDEMSPAPRTIDADANLMETAYTMITQNKRRLTILDSGEVIGIIREQDLLFEIERILREV